MDSIFLVSKHNFLWKVAAGNVNDRKRASYNSDVLFYGHGQGKRNEEIRESPPPSPSSSYSEFSSSPSELRVLLEKTCMTQFPIPEPETPPVAMSLRRTYQKFHQDYIISLCVNLDNELFQRIFTVMNEVHLKAGLGLTGMGSTPSEHIIEVLDIRVTKGLNGIVEKPFPRRATTFINKLLHAAKDVKGSFSVRLMQGSTENVVVPVIEKFESFNLCQKLFDEKKGSDCILVGENGLKVECHSAILCIHSEVFTTMLTIDMKESRTRQISIGMNEKSLDALLKFMYYWDTSIPAADLAIALDLLKAAHQYEIKSLESAMQSLFSDKCEKSEMPGWTENFHVDNLLELYLFADCIGSDYAAVKGVSVKLMKRHLEELKVSSMFKKIFKDNPNIAQEIFFMSFETD